MQAEVQRKAIDTAALEGKSVYFMVLDRFARTPSGNETHDAAACNSETDWCGGTLKGIEAHLDYIQGMGFDCIWITPVVKNYEGRTKDGTGFMGYWAKDLYKIDEHFGTPQDLKDLVEALHDRNMCMMQDFVANHMGPLHHSDDVKPLYPFNKVDHFHQLDIGTKNFDQYTFNGVTGKWPNPAQAMWSDSGGQCSLGESCNCYYCEKVPDSALGLPSSYGPCKGVMVFNESSPCPKDTLSSFCMPGDYGCKGYSEKVTQEGWFYDLGDLNQTNPFVRKELLKWVIGLRRSTTSTHFD